MATAAFSASRWRVIAPLVPLMLTVACGDGRRDAAILDATLQEDRTLVLTVTACNARDNRVTVKENVDSVTVAVITDDPPGGDACADGIVVTLTEPLGGRRLIDAATGEPVEVARSR